MNLRTQILMLLFLLGLAPVLAALALNLPLVFDRLELYYHKAHLQNLRADFRDLDQHLSSRHEMVRLLARLPEADALMGASRSPSGMPVELVRAHYTRWVNRIFQDHLDIIQILFLDEQGNPQFWLERDPESYQLLPSPDLKGPPSEEFFHTGMQRSPGTVHISAISINPGMVSEDPRRFMMLRLISPIVGLNMESSDTRASGAVVLSIDVGGLARAYRDTYWVINDGSYLGYHDGAPAGENAFEDFPGLQRIFANGKLDLWQGSETEQVIWVPMFLTEKSGPLWVGRRVDPSPISEIRQELKVRVASILLVIVLVIWVVARWLATRAEDVRRDLTNGIRRMLETAEPVLFNWRGPQELQSLGAKLTQLADTHAMHSEALREHARELEESNRYKSEFLANVSHELRTPLNSILLLSKILVENPAAVLSEEQARQAGVIHAAGKDLRSLIDDILDLARIEARQPAFQVEEVDLPAMLRGLADLVRPQFDAKQLSMELRIDDSVPLSIVSDADKLGQIVKNFLSNAVKFTQRGGVSMCLEANSAEDAQVRPLAIRVRDTGIGIPGDKSEVVFEAFKQADGSTSRRFGGTGLGLTISRELAHLMGGRIILKSKEGEGSTFSLLLPLRMDTELVEPYREPIPASNKRVARVDVPAVRFDGLRVLMVDDDMRNLLALTPLLKSWGMQVTAAGDGEEALESLEEEPHFDLVLMDIMVPGTDGYATMRRVRAMKDYKETPIIAISDSLGEDTVEQASEAGADGFLAKPPQPAELAGQIGRLTGSGA